MNKFETKQFEIIGVQFEKDNVQDFVDAIGPGAQYLTFDIKEVVGMGRGMRRALVIRSVAKTWTIGPGDWLAIFDNGVLLALDNTTFNTFFEGV